MGDITKDERFASVLKSRQFMKVPRRERKTKIDKRFHAMFTDKSFKVKHAVDKRGRPIKYHTSSEELKKFYDVSSESDGENEESEPDHDDKDTSLVEDIKPISKEEKVVKSNCSNDDDDEEEKDDDVDDEQADDSDADDDEQADDSDADDNDVKSSGSESTTDEEESELSEEDGEFDHKWEELDTNVPTAQEITSRLAVCNMDWDRIRAEDILSVFDSLKPEGSVIHSVKVYPSEFGLKRMEEEKLHGPLELVQDTINGDEIKDDSTKEGSRYHREKLRQYQLNRLKYYYAVVECDTPETADALYGQVNGMEYESSGVCFDLRFIPDGETFDQEPKSQALGAPNPSEYKPRLFVNTALQQVKVNLTWDETDPKRRETLQRAFRCKPEEIEEDIKVYLASSSSSSEDEGPLDENESDAVPKVSEKERVEKYRALLQQLQEEEENKKDDREFDIEFTWDSGLERKTKELVKEKLENSEKMNPFDEKVKRMKDERKQKKKEKKMEFQMNKELSDKDDASEDEEIEQKDMLGHASKHSKFGTKKNKNNNVTEDKKANELALMVSDLHDNDSDEEGNTKWRKQKKNKKEVENDDFQMDIEDPRFSAIYTSHLYNIDPSDPHYKETKGMQNIVQEKQKLKRKYQAMDSASGAGKVSKQTSLSAESQHLVNSVRNKAMFHSKKKK